MTERPILFSAPMVRAILAGTKTQTRRVVKPQPSHFVGGPGVTDADGNPWPREPAIDEQSCSLVIRCPYGQPGDRLWVREAWRGELTDDARPPRDLDPGCAVWYEADGARVIARPSRVDSKPGKLRPGMFMPRWASRITLEVTDVRVERLHEISEADAEAEGVAEPNERLLGVTPYRARFFKLWESINGPGSWDANPWVWVVEFKRVGTSA